MWHRNSSPKPMVDFALSQRNEVLLNCFMPHLGKDMELVPKDFVAAFQTLKRVDSQYTYEAKPLSKEQSKITQATTFDFEQHLTKFAQHRLRYQVFRMLKHSRHPENEDICVDNQLEYQLVDGRCECLWGVMAGLPCSHELFWHRLGLMDGLAGLVEQRWFLRYSELVQDKVDQFAAQVQQTHAKKKHNSEVEKK